MPNEPTRQDEDGPIIESSPSADSAPQRRADNDGLHRRRGIWYYCLVIDGERRFFSTKTRNYQDARRVRANAIKAQLENRLPTEKAKWRFEQLAAQVLEDRKPHLGETTIRLERERSGPLLKYFSGRRASEINNAAIRAYQTARSKAVGNRTVNLETKLLRQVLKDAKLWGPLADDYKAFPRIAGVRGARSKRAKSACCLRSPSRGPAATLPSTPRWPPATRRADPSN